MTVMEQRRKYLQNPSLFLVSLALHASLIALGSCCIFKYGSEPDDISHHSAHGGTVWGYAYLGLDWQGVDANNNAWTCFSGKQQSPINVPSTAGMAQVPLAARTIFDYGKVTSNGSNIEVINNGHTIQIEFPGGWFKPNVSVALPGPGPAQGPLTRSLQASSASPGDYTRVALEPVQFHFHTRSEHTLQTMMFALEVHIVNRVRIPGCPDIGCITVVGAMFEASPEHDVDHPFLAQLWDVMPLKDDTINLLPAGRVLDFSQLLPPNQTYATYAGSLTTPPCTEGILWHVLLQPQPMSMKQYENFLVVTGDKDCSAVNASSSSGAAAGGGSASASGTHRLLMGTGAAAVAAAGQGSRSRLLAEEIGDHPDVIHESIFENATGLYQCRVLGSGQNYRLLQAANQRAIRLFLDDPSGLGQPARPTPPPPPPPPQLAPVPASPPPSPSDDQDGVVQKDDSTTGVIIVSVVCGLAGGGILSGLLLYMWRKRQSKVASQKFWASQEERMGIMAKAYSEGQVGGPSTSEVQTAQRTSSV